MGIRQVELIKVMSLVPQLDLLRLFEQMVFSIYEKINMNELESENLENLRDSVLPKLLSGFFEKAR